MEYYAEYTILIDDATWGREDFCFDADSEEEAKEIALEYEKTYIEVRDGRVKELLLDNIYDEEGNEIAWEK